MKGSGNKDGSVWVSVTELRAASRSYNAGTVCDILTGLYTQGVGLDDFAADQHPYRSSQGLPDEYRYTRTKLFIVPPNMYNFLRLYTARNNTPPAGLYRQRDCRRLMPFQDLYDPPT